MIYEVVFTTTLAEKQDFLSAKKTVKARAQKQLNNCSDIIRIGVKASSSKLKSKTVEAIIGHIIQTLPTAGGGYCEPLIQGYLKALGALFEHQSNVDLLRKEIWLEAINFCVQGINQYLDDLDGDFPGSMHSFSGFGINDLSGSVARSTTNNSRSQPRQGSVSRQNVEDLFQILMFLISPAHAPLSERYSVIATCTMQFLQWQGSNASQIHQVAFSIINKILCFTCADRTVFSQDIASKAIPIISRFWQEKSLPKDNMLNSVKDEMLILLLSVHLHLERTLMDEDSADLLSKLEDLLAIFTAEYAKRSERDQLQLDDLEMTDIGGEPSDSYPLQLFAWHLKPHNLSAERNWANVQVIGILEQLVSRQRVKSPAMDEDIGHNNDKHPRKRQRIAQLSDRLLQQLKNEDEGLRRATLQTLPFVFHTYQLKASALGEILKQLHYCTGDKRGNIGSWALLAIAR